MLSNSKESKLKRFFKNIGNKFADALYPVHIKCFACGEELNEKAVNDCCEDCIPKLPFISHACVRCGAETGENNDGICFNCEMNNFDFELARSVFVYDGEIAKAIYKYKYKSAKYLAENFGTYLITYLKNWNIKPDIITAVPLHLNREKKRGYNQSKCMAEFVADYFSIPYMDLCIKIKDNEHQAKLGYRERKENVLDAYKFDSQYKKAVRHKNILLIDDVYTTGATVSEMAKMLKNAKTKSVYVLTLAHDEYKAEL